ncbi:MAG: Hpt domain-containing protein [Gammaproteobacteria bacterium]|nr:Hpt domain-containing protein [Gammaproteobacteria bacterium]
MDHSIIDWNLSKKLAGNNDQTAKEILAFLIKTLPADLNQIKEHFLQNQTLDLAKSVHRLHGALCYCGVPRLKAATQELELALKQKKSDELNTLFSQFEHEANELLRLYSRIIST